MKKVLVTLVLVMTLGVSVSFAQAAPVEVPVVEKGKYFSNNSFIVLYPNQSGEPLDTSFFSKLYTCLLYTSFAIRTRLSHFRAWLRTSNVAASGFGFGRDCNGFTDYRCV